MKRHKYSMIHGKYQNSESVSIIDVFDVLSGSWFEGFHPAEGPMNFKPESGKELQVDFVTKESNEFGYAVTEKLRLIRIPLRDTGFYEVVAMPNNDNDHIGESLRLRPKLNKRTIVAIGFRNPRIDFLGVAAAC